MSRRVTWHPVLGPSVWSLIRRLYSPADTGWTRAKGGPLAATPHRSVDSHQTNSWPPAGIMGESSDPGAALGGCEVSREQFAATLVELQTDSGVVVSKWSTRAQCAVPMTLTMHVPTHPLPPSSDEVASPQPVPSLSWWRQGGASGDGLLSSLLSSSSGERGAHILRLGDCLGVHSLCEHPHANLLPGLGEPHFTLSVYYTRTGRGGIARRKSLLLLFPSTQRLRFECIARALLYGLHAGALALTFFDGSFARYLLHTPLDAAVDTVSEKLSARAAAASVLGHLDSFWWAGFGGMQRNRSSSMRPTASGAPSELAAPLLWPGSSDEGEAMAGSDLSTSPGTPAILAMDDVAHHVAADAGPQVVLFVNGVQLPVAPCDELAALLRRILPQLPATHGQELSTPPEAAFPEAATPEAGAVYERAAPDAPMLGLDATMPVPASPPPPPQKAAPPPVPPPPPPPPPPVARGQQPAVAAARTGKGAPPPPPPPPPLRGVRALASEAEAAVRYSKDVVTAFREWTRIENQRHHSRGAGAPSTGSPSSARTQAAVEDVEGDAQVTLSRSIEHRSPYHAAIKRDVESFGADVSRLAAVARACVVTDGDLAPIRDCLRQLDAVLGSLTDERAVLRHFPEWPEAKVDAMREINCLAQECSALCAGLSSWRRGGGGAAQGAAHGGAVRPPPLDVTPLPGVIAAAAKALAKVQPRIELLVREQDGA